MRLNAYLLLALCAAPVLLAGCGGLPASTEPTGAIVVFAAFEGAGTDAPTIRSIAQVVVGGVRGQFDGPSERELILRNIPFGDEDPPKQPMTVTAPGYKTVAQQLELRKDIATFVDLTMEAVDTTVTGTVQATVRGSDGAPLLNALVRFFPAGGGDDDTVSGFTDSAGVVAVGGIPTGPVTVEAVAAGYLPETVDITVQPDAGGTNSPLSFTLLSGDTKVTVRGLVSDLRLQTPIDGVTVTIADRPSVQTGSDGRFTVPDVPVGKKPIKATLAGYDDYEDEINVLPGMGTVQVLMSRASGEPPGVPHTIAGTVTLLGAADNAGAVVVAFNINRGTEMARYTTGADGRYYLFVPAGRYELRVTFGSRTITRTVDYEGEGRVLDGIDFTLSASP